jgi:Zn-dependent M28 family amino/carboxypeptidase
VLYTVSSHFDSVERGPGADDDTSGTAALLEVARVLATRPQPATLHFAFFTGEEAGLLGSREYVRRAVERGDRLVGALNNDMIGFANDQRLDNTIRYSNDGIRDVQHAAAFLFTDLITYDAKYYKSTDAHAYYDAYGDIVGGIGSYPILGNPHYHQTHDQLETINHQLVAEVAKTTAATLMQLAHVPSRPKIAQVRTLSPSRELDIRWEPVPERDVTGYLVRVLDAAGNEKVSRSVARGAEPTLRVPYERGDVVEIWAVNERGRSWDAARVELK